MLRFAFEVVDLGVHGLVDHERDLLLQVDRQLFDEVCHTLRVLHEVRSNILFDSRVKLYGQFMV